MFLTADCHVKRLFVERQGFLSPLFAGDWPDIKYNTVFLKNTPPKTNMEPQN